ncbi:MAG: 6-bladed beta-propeller [Nitrospirota bacterium]|nr:6-bladed beta-propeller [Nitrospirota bacterium]
MMRNFLRLLVIMTLAISVLIGCASTPGKKERVVFWPDPPEEPRISYIKSYRTETDFRGKSFFDMIFGVSNIALFSKPYGVYSDGGLIYATDTASGGVLVYNPLDKKMRFIMGDKDKLQRPVGVATAADGTVFVSDAKQSKIFGYDNQGKQVMTIGSRAQLNNPAGIAINKDLGRLYITDSREHKVFVFSVKGEFLFSFGQQGTGDGEFIAPTNVAIDRRNGTVYIVDTLNCRVQVFDKDGKFLRKFGELGDSPGSFTRPKGIGVDTEGHVYVADAAFDNFQIFDENGQILMFVGSAGRGPGRFSLPAGMYVDENDVIYVADQVNQRIQLFQFLSDKWKKDHPEEYQKILAPKQEQEKSGEK